MIKEWFWCWLFKKSARWLHKNGYDMYVMQAEEWKKIFSYSLSNNGPPRPAIVVTRQVAEAEGER